MRYIKKYEDVKFGLFSGDLKKYIIISTINTHLMLFEVNDSDYSVALKAFYDNRNISHDINNNNFFKIKNTISFDDKLIYQSDSLDDALEYFNMKVNTNKYNL
jgi:hypothetical protein